MKMSKFETVRAFLGAAAAAVPLAFLPVATYSTVISDTLTADETKLTASDGAPFDQFGISVSVSGNTAVIGAFADDDNGATSGSAYVFENLGGVWVEVAKLTASDAAAGDRFGQSVSVSGNTAVVGADLDDDNGTDSGSAYVFANVGGAWYEVAKITASDGAPGDHFSFQSVSVSGTTAVVGTSGGSSAYVFENFGGVWVEVAKLTASDGAPVSRFGLSVSLSGNTVVVGDPFGTDVNPSSAYVFEKMDQVWLETAKLTASDGAPFDRFGISVSLSGDTAVVGAIFASVNSSGSAYVFELRDLTPAEQTVNLIAGIEDLVAEGFLSSGAGTSLIKQLENALKSLVKGNDNAVIKQLAAFANVVQALIDGGLLTEEEGLPLIDAALSTIDQILAG